MSSLLYVTDLQPGILRVTGRRVRYVDATSGREITDAAALDRIRRLAVPPAWTDVWICPDPSGHVQATGRDAKGRKQYRYHPDFRSRRERHKFNQLVPFGGVLGPLRHRLDRDLRSPGLSRERVLAAVVSLLDRTYIRIGNEAYARQNRSFGLTTLRCAHVDVHSRSLHMQFRGKAGKDLDITCCDARLARVVRRCQELPGQLLFQYVDADGEPAPICSTDVNAYLREVSGIDLTAKTFRTWGASVLAATELSRLDPPTTPRAAASAIKESLGPVAARLGNTVTVCRNSYVHPVVLSAFESGRLRDRWEAGPSRPARGLTADERRLLAVLSAGSRRRRSG